MHPITLEDFEVAQQSRWGAILANISLIQPQDPETPHVTPGFIECLIIA